MSNGTYDNNQKNYKLSSLNRMQTADTLPVFIIAPMDAIICSPLKKLYVISFIKKL